jgi:hypothetical protein
VTSLERCREIVRESHAAFEIEPPAAAALAEACAYGGEPDRALRTAEEAVTGARQRCLGMVPLAQLSLARVLLRTRGLASRNAIEAALEEASRLSRKMEFKLLEPLFCVARAELARLVSRRDNAAAGASRGASAVSRNRCVDPRRRGREATRLGDRLMMCVKNLHPAA